MQQPVFRMMWGPAATRGAMGQHGSSGAGAPMGDSAREARTWHNLTLLLLGDKPQSISCFSGTCRSLRSCHYCGLS